MKGKIYFDQSLWTTTTTAFVLLMNVFSKELMSLVMSHVVSFLGESGVWILKWKGHRDVLMIRLKYGLQLVELLHPCAENLTSHNFPKLRYNAYIISRKAHSYAKMKKNSRKSVTRAFRNISACAPSLSLPTATSPTSGRLQCLSFLKRTIRIPSLPPSKIIDFHISAMKTDVSNPQNTWKMKFIKRSITTLKPRT